MNKETLMFDLTKKVSFALEKVGLEKLVAQVAAIFDVSGSTEDLYKFGTMQEALNVISAIAFNLDDNENLDTYIFGDNCIQIQSVIPSNYSNFIKQEIINKKLIGGSTYYYKFVQQLIDDYFNKETPNQNVFKGLFQKVFGKKNTDCNETENDFPVFAIVLTDGEDLDQEKTKEILNQYTNKNIFWQFIGIGNAKQFDFIKSLSQQHGNIGFSNVQDLAKTKNEALLEQLISGKFAGWIKKNENKERK